jgi:hypothetical protein
MANLTADSVPNSALQSIDEAALLIICLRDLPFLVPGDTDWQALLSLATAHGVLLLVYQSFLERNIEIPTFFAAAVQEQRDVAEMYAAELESLLKIFAEHGIETLPLKGPVLAEALYGDVTQRSYNDLDLLVRRDDFARAEILLLDMGFIALAGDETYHSTFIRLGVVVELHFGVGSPPFFPSGFFQFDVDGVWSRTTRGTFRGLPIRVMSEDDLVLFLCLHGFQHGFSRLIWIKDIARALGAMRCRSAEELAQNARRQKLELALLIGCEIVRETLQQLPQEMDVLAAESREVNERVRHAVRLLFAEDTGTNANREVELWSFYLQTEQSLRRRWSHRLGFLAPTASDFAWAERHGINRGLMIILRPFRLLQKYGMSSAWRVLFPREV